MLTTATLVRQVLEGIRSRGDFSYAVESMTNGEMNRLMAALPRP
jgi:hypothetical protein